MTISYNKSFASKEQAEEYIVSECARFNPAGYGTTLKASEQSDGTWLVQGYRFKSCE